MASITGGSVMALSNAEKQARWRERNQVVLTEHARVIAEKLIDMEDQAKLRKIARFINDHLKHPDRTPEERGIALGRIGVSGPNGPLGKRAALEYVRNPPPPQKHSWLVEAVTKNGKRWRNGVRLRTKEEAEVYVEAFARFNLEKAGYIAGRVVRSDDEPNNCSIIRTHKRGRPNLVFQDGQCVLLHWHADTGEVVEVIDL
jgi:hypothetical protein